MKKITESIIFVLLTCVFLCACGAESFYETSFELGFYGECTATENALLCAGNGEISAYSVSGEKLCTAKNTASDLRFSTAGSYAAIFGEKDIYIFDGKEIRHNCDNNKIMSTEINPNGYTAICTEEAGCKGSVTVYNAAFIPVYKWYCASGYLIKASLSQNNTLAVLTANEDGSCVRVFKLNSEKERFSLSFEKELVFDFQWQRDRLCLVSENAVYFADEGEYTSFAFDGYLGEYVLSDELAVFEVLTGDGTSTVLCFDAEGRQSGETEGEMLTAMAAANYRIAVVCGGEVCIYNEKMKELYRCDGRGVREILLNDDAALLVRDCTVTVLQYNP